MPDAAAMKHMDAEQVNGGARAVPTIRLSNITKMFSGVVALSDVSVDIHPGEVHAILGENGAGKSTLMNIISGVLQPDIGVIEFDGDVISPMTPERSAALGVSISYQHPAVLDDLSVLENLRVALPDRVFAAGNPAEIARVMAELNAMMNEARVAELTLRRRKRDEEAMAILLLSDI